MSETSVDFGACLIFCKLLCLAQRHSRLAVGLSISVSLKDVCRIKSHSSKTTRIALEFIVGLRYSLLYFLVEVSLPLLVQDKKDTTTLHMRKVEYSFCRIKLELCSYLADFVHLNNEQRPLLFDFYLSLFIFIQTDPFTRTYLRVSAYVKIEWYDLLKRR